MNTGVLFWLPITMTLVLSGCSHNPVGPTYKDPAKDTWTVDTLAFVHSSQTSMRSVWASTDSDVYVVGHSDDIRGEMWHYNGRAWSIVNLSALYGGTISGAFDLSAVYGFGSNDVWAVGQRLWLQNNAFLDSSLIIHWNGVQWRESKVTGGALIAVGGSGPDDIWATGANTVFHFDGISWHSAHVSIPPQGIRLFSVTGVSSDDAYMVGYRNDVVQPADTNAYFLYHFDGTSWSVEDSIVQTAYSPSPSARFGVELFSVKGITFSAGNNIVFQKVGTSWTNVFQASGIWIVGGNDVNDLYALGGYGTIYYFNGSDWKPETIPYVNATLYGVWTDGKEVFIVGNDGSKTYIFHGQ